MVMFLACTTLSLQEIVKDRRLLTIVKFTNDGLPKTDIDREKIDWGELSNG